MKKYITVENKIFEAHLVIDVDKINDEILPYNRKKGTGADKNLFAIGLNFYSNLKLFFPKVIKDKEENKTGRNAPTIKNFFLLSSLINDIDVINKEIKNKFLKETEIDDNEYYRKCSDLVKKQKLNSCFYITSEISYAKNGIAFKNWGDDFKSIIKVILLPTTQLKVYLFTNSDNTTCAFWEFKQEYIQKSKPELPVPNNNKLIQKIFYGAPGTGKSHTVNEIIKGKLERTQRVTFHPEFDYASFVGGYKPTMDGNEIRYEFVPQAFTNIYIDAWNDLENDYYLVIEEINRGNCAEIFGDIFQLLDRTNSYEITPSKELREYLELQFSENNRIDSRKMILPPNLNIIATMNTSDQSLLPMDSAFKRRWDWEYIPINYIESAENKSSQYRVQISENKSFSWLKFIQSVNSVIKLNDNLGMDKCMGNYFIKPENNIIDINTFINKAMFYLWNDVFKDETEDQNIFKNKMTYEDFFPIMPDGIGKIEEILKYLNVDISNLTAE